MLFECAVSVAMGKSGVVPTSRQQEHVHNDMAPPLRRDGWVRRGHRNQNHQPNNAPNIPRYRPATRYGASKFKSPQSPLRKRRPSMANSASIGSNQNARPTSMPIPRANTTPRFLTRRTKTSKMSRVKRDLKTVNEVPINKKELAALQDGHVQGLGCEDRTVNPPHFKNSI